MADEIAQVCMMEIEGIKMVFMGTLETAQLLMRMIRSLIKYCKDHSEAKREKKLSKPGKKDLIDLVEISNGSPVTLTLPETMVKEILEKGSEVGLRYSTIVDFIPNDKMIPVAFTPTEAPLWAAIIKAITSVGLEETGEKVKEYEKRIDEEKEKLFSAKSPEEKKAIETRLGNLKQAMEEAKKEYADLSEICNQDEKGVSLADYLKTAKGTEFETYPEKAIAELEKGVEIGSKVAAKECLQPVRDISSRTKTGMMYYQPDTGETIAREFLKDEETGLLYSVYSFKTQDGELCQFSDRNISNEKWNDEILPKLLDKAGLIEGTQCRIFDQSSKIQAYLKYHNQVRPEEEIRAEKALKEGRQVFSNAETEREIEYVISQRNKALFSAKVENDRITFSVDPNQLIRKNGKLSMRVDEDNTFLISKIENERLEDGKAVFEIEKDAEILHVRDNSSDHPKINPVTGEECKKIMDHLMSDNTMSANLKRNQKR